MNTARLIFLFALITLTRIPQAGAAQTDHTATGSLAERLATLLPGMAADDIAARAAPQQEWQELCLDLGAPGREAERAEACRLMAARLGPDTPAPARAWLVRQLEYIGRDECVDALAALIDDPEFELRDAALRALARNPAPVAGARLREALAATSGPAPARVGLINALGFRAEESSVPVLAAQLAADDAAVITAAATALGQTGTAPAARALSSARTAAPAEARSSVDAALLVCAGHLAAAGGREAAVTLYRELAKAEGPTRHAALNGLIETGGDRTAARIIRKALTEADTGARAVALAQVPRISRAALRGVLAGLPELPPPAQAALLGALATRGDRTALRAVGAAAESAEPEVKTAALRALGHLGDASVLPMLVDTWQAGGDSAGAAREALASLRARGIDRELTALMAGAPDPAQQARFIELLADRRAVVALPALAGAAAAPDAGVRRAAVLALGRLGRPEHVAGMVEALLQMPDPAQREEAEKAIAALCSRIPDADRRAAPLLPLYSGASPAAQTAMLPLLGRVGGPRALEVVRPALSSPEHDRSEAALRALGNWPDASVIDELLAFAAATPDPEQRAEALQHFGRFIGRDEGRGEEERLALITRAMALAERPRERRLMLERAAAIRDIRSVRFAAPYLDDPELGERAARTIVELARQRPLRERHRAELVPLLERIAETSANAELKQEAAQRAAGQ